LPRWAGWRPGKVSERPIPERSAVPDEPAPAGENQVDHLGGFHPAINIAVGIAVATGSTVLFLEYLEQTRGPESREEE
jgi:hypothetical protein